MRTVRLIIARDRPLWNSAKPLACREWSIVPACSVSVSPKINALIREAPGQYQRFRRKRKRARPTPTVRSPKESARASARLGADFPRSHQETQHALTLLCVSPSYMSELERVLAQRNGKQWASEVYDWLFLGNARDAKNLDALHDHKISASLSRFLAFLICPKTVVCTVYPVFSAALASLLPTPIASILIHTTCALTVVAHILNVADDVPCFFEDRREFVYKQLGVRDFGADQGISRVFDSAFKYASFQSSLTQDSLNSLFSASVFTA